MFATNDTIVAVATPSGHGGVGLVRVSGPRAHEFATRLAGRAAPFEPRHATRVTLHEALAADALVTFFPGPRSYTGDDVVEISAHGSPVLLATIVERVVRLGARPAQPGEFTLRAFLHGKIDLVQAEGVRDLVDAVSPAQVVAASAHLDGSLSARIVEIAGDLRQIETLLEASVDFPDDGYRFIDPADLRAGLERVSARMAGLVSTASRGALVREGARVVIAGRPNVGKSSLFNALVGAERAIVTPIAGTTRDLVSERVVVHGALVHLVDTAGVRESVDEVEREGVRRATLAAEGADLVIVVVDGSCALSAEDRELAGRWPARRRVLVTSKADLARAWTADAEFAGAIAVSATTGAGVAAVCEKMVEMLNLAEAPAADVLVTNVRHRQLLEAAGEHVARAVVAAGGGGSAPLPEEFVIADVRLALGALEEVTGRRSPEALLTEIFANFCIGK